MSVLDVYVLATSTASLVLSFLALRNVWKARKHDREA